MALSGIEEKFGYLGRANAQEVTLNMCKAQKPGLVSFNNASLYVIID